MVKKAGDIKRVLQEGRRWSGRAVNIFFLPSSLAEFAVLVPRRVGGAVQRNRMKRLAREVYRKHQVLFADGQVLFFIKRFEDHLSHVEKDVLDFASRRLKR